MRPQFILQLLSLLPLAQAFSPSALQFLSSSALRPSALSPLAPAAFTTSIPKLSAPRRSAARLPIAGGLRAQISFSDAVTEILKRKFKPSDIKRVTKCWKDMDSGKEIKKYFEEFDTNQECNSYVEGLSVKAFHDAYQHPWAEGLRDKAHIIQDEFKRVAITGESDLKEKGSNVWVTVEDAEAADSYGPGWKTLGLMDRCIWDTTNTQLFPETTKLIEDLQVPCSEAFFARMLPGSKIKAHTDFCNFVLTSHLGVDVPEGECWIGVGNERREWRNGEVLLFDTSLMHEAENNAEKMRYILMFRIWHPELTIHEINAIKYIFLALEDPERVERDILSLAPELVRPPEPKKQSLDLDFEPNPAGNRKQRRKAQKRNKASSGGAGFG